MMGSCRKLNWYEASVFARAGNVVASSRAARRSVTYVKYWSEKLTQIDDKYSEIHGKIIELFDRITEIDLKIDDALYFSFPVLEDYLSRIMDDFDWCRKFGPDSDEARDITIGQVLHALREVTEHTCMVPYWLKSIGSDDDVFRGITNTFDDPMYSDFADSLGELKDMYSQIYYDSIGLLSDFQKLVGVDEPWAFKYYSVAEPDPLRSGGECPGAD